MADVAGLGLEAGKRPCDVADDASASAGKAAGSRRLPSSCAGASPSPRRRRRRRAADRRRRRARRGATAVEQARRLRERLLAHAKGEAYVRGMADGQRQPGAAGQYRRAGSRAEHDAPVLGGHAARPHLGRVARRRAHREDLVEHERIVQPTGQRLDRGPDAQHAAVLVEHREALVGPAAGAARRARQGRSRAPARRRPHESHATTARPPPRAPRRRRARAARGRTPPPSRAIHDAPRTRTPPAGDRRAHGGRSATSTGLCPAGPAALVHRHRRPAIDQRMRGRQAGDPGADDRDVRPAGHPARPAGGRHRATGAPGARAPCSSWHSRSLAVAEGRHPGAAEGEEDEASGTPG